MEQCINKIQYKGIMKYSAAIIGTEILIMLKHYSPYNTQRNQVFGLNANRIQSLYYRMPVSSSRVRKRYWRNLDVNCTYGCLIALKDLIWNLVKFYINLPTTERTNLPLYIINIDEKALLYFICHQHKL